MKAARGKLAVVTHPRPDRVAIMEALDELRAKLGPSILPKALLHYFADEIEMAAELRSPAICISAPSGRFQVEVAR